MARDKATRVEFVMNPDDLALLDKLAAERLTRRGDLVREALYAHFPLLKANYKKRSDAVAMTVGQGGWLRVAESEREGPKRGRG